MELFTYRIAEVFDRFSSGKNITEDGITESGSYPVFGGNGLRGYTETYNFDGECILIGRQGAKCGNVRYFNGKGYMTDHAIVGVCNENHNALFMNYALTGLNLNRLSGQAAQPGLSVGMLKKQKILLPSLEMQTCIANIVMRYNQLIENNNKRIKILEQMAERLYKEWFVRFRFPGYENAEFEDGVPCGWTYMSTEELSSVLQRGISPVYDDEGAYTIINQKCIRTAIMDTKESRRQSKAYKKELNLQDCDTVICSTGTGTLGRVGKVYGVYENTTFDSHVTLVRTNNIVGKHYLYFALKQLQPWFMNMGIGSTNQQELYRRTIKNAKILVSNNQVLNATFETHAEAIHRQIIILINTNKNLTLQRDMLLPRLMSGKLEV